MQKILSFMLALLLIVVPYVGYAEHFSPDISGLYWSDPAVPFKVLDGTPEWPDIYSEINHYYDLSGLNHGDTFTMDEALLIAIEKRITRIYWHFPTSFSDCSRVNVIFVPTDMSYAKTFSARIIKADDTIMLSIGTLTPGLYYMIVYGKR